LITVTTTAGESAMIHAAMWSQRHPCPVCGYLTIPEPGRYDICPICFWEDDPDQVSEPDLEDGPNHRSLNEARANVARFGWSKAEARDPKLVRDPQHDEIPPERRSEDRPPPVAPTEEDQCP
jgi:rubredoxin